VEEERLMENKFEQTAPFYDLDQRAKKEEDIPFYISRAESLGDPVLEVACGTGRIAIPLAKQGFDVYGLDFSEEMLSVFEKKCKEQPGNIQKRLTAVQADMTHFSFDTLFRLIFIPFRSFQALKSDEEAKKCLASVYRHLDVGGEFIINVFRPMEKFIERWKKGQETQDTTAFLDNGEFITRYTILQELDTRHRLMYFDYLYRVNGEEIEADEYRDSMRLRYYYGDDLRQLLSDTGFAITEEMGWYDGRPVEGGQEFIFVCKKR
jgi:ubiquinone/menaquinone biosynthesis C-methylase UbiE